MYKFKLCKVLTRLSPYWFANKKSRRSPYWFANEKKPPALISADGSSVCNEM